jgi:hypothetical protein
MRKYIRENQFKFNKKQVDQFIVAHKFLMAEKA